MRKQKSYSLWIILAVIILPLFVFMFPQKEVEEEPVVEDNDRKYYTEKACEVKEHYKVYLGTDEVYFLDDIGYLSQNEKVASVSANKVTGHEVGTTTLIKDCNVYEVEVTDMITAPYMSAEKPWLPCGRYTEEENEYLDEILRTKVADRGYHTRAGVVQAARFLTLQFPYHLGYFNENGRLPYCDGEGRFYHEGLYLNGYKKEDLARSVLGPATWGCSLYCAARGKYLDNSLDCSGFVSWTLINGGFDPGDIGAGPMAGVTDLSDLGEKHPISRESLQEVKVGDLFSANGHIAILIGIKDDEYYIAESTWGVDVRCYNYSVEKLLSSTFRNWVDMDEFYEHQDGKLSRFWS